MHAAEAQAKCIVRLIGKAEHLPLFISVKDNGRGQGGRSRQNACTMYCVPGNRPTRSFHLRECAKWRRRPARHQHKSFFIEMAERWLTLADDWELAPLGRRYALDVPI
jgi:hypothetical protein